MAGERLRQCRRRRPDDPHRARCRVDVLRHGALGPARSVLPARRARDWRDGIEDGVAGLTVGVLRNPGFDAPADADGIAAVERAAQLLADAGAYVEQADADLPDTSLVFGRVWGAALSRLVASTPTQLVGLLDPGIREVAETLGGMTAVEFMDAEATRATAGHAMARLHQRYDLVLCPTVPAGPPLADAPTVDPVRALWTAWAPWTFTFNLTPPAGDHGADGRRARTGCRTRCRSRRRSSATIWCCAPLARSRWRSRSRWRIWGRDKAAKRQAMRWLPPRSPIGSPPPRWPDLFSDKPRPISQPTLPASRKTPCWPD